MYAARSLMKLRTLSFVFGLLTVISRAAAMPPPKPGSAVCKADLKAWSASKTETLAIADLNERMNVMFACADLSKKHEKRARAYLDEFYRTRRVSETSVRFHHEAWPGRAVWRGGKQSFDHSGAVWPWCQRTMRFHSIMNWIA